MQFNYSRKILQCVRVSERERDRGRYRKTEKKRNKLLLGKNMTL